MSELEKYKEKLFLGLKRKPVQIFTLEELQAMEQKTNDEYENSDNEMFIEDADFFKTIISQSLFIHIGNGQYILDYEKIQKIRIWFCRNLSEILIMMCLIIGVILTSEITLRKKTLNIMKVNDIFN